MDMEVVVVVVDNDDDVDVDEQIQEHVALQQVVVILKRSC